MSMQWEKLKAEREEAAAQLQESILRYKAESDPLSADIEINNSQNLIKLLTHAGQMHHEKTMQSVEHQHQTKNIRRE